MSALRQQTDGEHSVQQQEEHGIVQESGWELRGAELRSLLEEGLDDCDLQFALRHAPKEPHFLAYLLAKAREGHLCSLIQDDQLTPSFGKWDPLLIEQAKRLNSPAVVIKNNRYYLKRNEAIEHQFLTHLRRLEEGNPPPCQMALPEQLNEEQRRVMETVLRQPVTWISGGPGTGKSFTAACLIQGFQGSVLVAAPTGKAAANLRKKIKEVSTLHRLLAKRERIGADLLVIDEGSMVDAATYAQIFSRIKTGARVAIFGDRYQLPPVSSGNFFADCAHLSSCHLTTSLRTNLQEIIDLSERVKEGKPIPFLPLTTNIPWQEGTVLTPLRQGPFGVEALNRQIAAKVQSDQIPIMITQNCPPLDLYNGDIGVLKGDKAFFDEREFAAHLLPPYELAYALSVHKSQGSEYDHVIVLLPEGSERFGREMLYTAITRARCSVRVFAATGVLEKVLANSELRFSGLRAERKHV